MRTTLCKSRIPYALPCEHLRKPRTLTVLVYPQGTLLIPIGDGQMGPARQSVLAQGACPGSWSFLAPPGARA